MAEQDAAQGAWGYVAGAAATLSAAIGVGMANRRARRIAETVQKRNEHELRIGVAEKRLDAHSETQRKSEIAIAELSTQTKALKEATDELTHEVRRLCP